MPSVDVTAPSLPSLFAATSLTSSKINVGWEASTDACSGVAGYSLYKNGSLYRILTPATASLLEDGLDSTSSYAYKVQAFDYSGNTSALTLPLRPAWLSHPLSLNQTLKRMPPTPQLTSPAGHSKGRRQAL